MTPKEKAIKLVERFIPLFYYWDYYNDASRDINLVRIDAKQCALIAVDEIVKSNPIIPLSFMLESEAIDTAIEYWKEVKTEIEKL